MRRLRPRPPTVAQDLGDPGRRPAGGGRARRRSWRQAPGWRRGMPWVVDTYRPAGREEVRGVLYLQNTLHPLEMADFLLNQELIQPLNLAVFSIFRYGIPEKRPVAQGMPHAHSLRGIQGMTCYQATERHTQSNLTANCSSSCQARTTPFKHARYHRRPSHPYSSPYSRHGLSRGSPGPALYPPAVAFPCLPDPLGIGSIWHFPRPISAAGNRGRLSS